MEHAAADPSNPQNGDLLAFLAESGVTARAIENLTRSEGRASVTWRIQAAAGESFFLKRHESIGLYRREVAFYREVVANLAGSDEWVVPGLVAADDELGAIVITALPGDELDRSARSGDARYEVWRRAGAFARTLHEYPTDGLGTLAKRLYGDEQIARLLAAARPYVPRATMEVVESLVGDPRVWGGLEPVPVHADFSPRNWIVSADDRLGVIDWERSGLGYWIEDVQRLMFDYWHDDHGSERAFMEGYGRDMSAEERRSACLIAVINATGGIPWASERNDTAFVKLCALFLERAILELRALA